MSIQTCPTSVVAAPPERIWSLLTRPEEFARWSGTKLIDGPARELAAGDRVVFAPPLPVTLGLRITFDVLAIERLRQFRLDIHLPFGVTNHEVVQISPMDGGRCRVTFN